MPWTSHRRAGGSSERYQEGLNSLLHYGHISAAESVSFWCYSSLHCCHHHSHLHPSLHSVTELLRKNIKIKRCTGILQKVIWVWCEDRLLLPFGVLYSSSLSDAGNLPLECSFCSHQLCDNHMFPQNWVMDQSLTVMGQGFLATWQDDMLAGVLSFTERRTCLHAISEVYVSGTWEVVMCGPNEEAQFGLGEPSTSWPMLWPCWWLQSSLPTCLVFIFHP